MWIRQESYPVMDGEPHLGRMTESELIEEPGEALDILAEYIVDNFELPEEFTAIDEVSEFDINLETSDYLASHQISHINYYLENLEEDVPVDYDKVRAMMED